MKKLAIVKTAGSGAGITAPRREENFHNESEWREIFRETVLASDGFVSPEMGAWLDHDPMKCAKKEKDRLIALMQATTASNTFHARLLNLLGSRVRVAYNGDAWCGFLLEVGMDYVRIEDCDDGFTIFRIASIDRISCLK